MYADIYERHDTLARKRAAEEAISTEREKRKSTLQSRIEGLSELPALSSFLRIQEATSSCYGHGGNRARGAGGAEEGCEEDADGPTGESDCGEDDDGTAESRNGEPKKRDGFDRMRLCRMALEALDNGGWKRSYHQRLFHEAYIAACARPFWKLDPPGSFARAHQKILETNGWDNLSQEILISTPRR
jgi:hypothetical protein